MRRSCRCDVKAKTPDRSHSEAINHQNQQTTDAGDADATGPTNINVGFTPWSKFISQKKNKKQKTHMQCRACSRASWLILAENCLFSGLGTAPDHDLGNAAQGEGIPRRKHSQAHRCKCYNTLEISRFCTPSTLHQT